MQNDIAADALANAALEEAKKLARSRAERGASQHWHVVHCGARADVTAEKLIKLVGYEVYRPMVRELRPVKSNQLSKAMRAQRHILRREVVSALLPRYLFVCYDDDRDPWHDAFRLIGLRGMSFADDLPVRCDQVVERLRAKEVNGAIPIETLVAEISFAVGECVRIGHGLFAGRNARIDRLDAGQRIRLLLPALGGIVPVELNIGEVEKLTTP